MPQLGVARCAKHNTVVGTVASPSFVTPLLRLAASAHERAGFGCVAVMPMQPFAALNSTRLLQPLPHVDLLPRNDWCMPARVKFYGWRRSQLYRARLWRVVIAEGFDLLTVDCDWVFRAPPLMLTHRELANRGRRVDAMAVMDGPRNKYWNVGLMWLRSTPAVHAMTVRVENRTWGGWEQEVFNEELNFNAPEVGCCHSACLGRAMTKLTFNRTDAALRKSAKGNSARIALEGAPRCAHSMPSAAAPPNNSRLHWPRRERMHMTPGHGLPAPSASSAWSKSPTRPTETQGPWLPDSFNRLARKLRRGGRCTEWQHSACPKQWCI